MSKLLQVKLSQAPNEFLPKARAAAHANGVQLTGDHENGRFAGRGIEGAYRIEGDTLAIHIQKKPMILPWPMIESAVKSFFA
ncbi:MAG: uncharacterized protein H6R26_486 [Proteobacteria bacterium]|nr:uncharacterized protein [Pseudomonadota bacterium]